MLEPVVDFEECIGCGACLELCPQVFELGDEKSWVIDAGKCDGCNCQGAADICPVEAISIVEE